MIIHLVKCEECDSTYRFNPQLGPVYREMPDNWILLSTGDRTVDGLNYCSRECLTKSLGVTSPEPPATKMRRFWLIDGETADEFEGVLWGDGSVTRRESGFLEVSTCASWENFKGHHPGCGVTWIDQEVSDA